jgi:toxin ParE1/3/4
MKSYTIAYAPEFEDQLDRVEAFIEMASGSGVIAQRHTSRIKRHCECLKIAPRRGVRRDDLLPGLRVTHYKGSTVIAYVVESDVVWFLGVFYGGQDYETALSSIAVQGH